MKNEKIRRIDTIGGGVVVNASASGGGSGAAHVPVTLGAGSDPATTLIGQQLTVPAYGAQMAAHALLATGVHGAGASTLATVANIATHAALQDDVHGLHITAGKAFTLTESLTLNALPVGGLAVATAANVLGSLAVGVAGQYLSGAGAGTVPAWATLNQAAVAGLTTGDGPTFDHLHITADVAAATLTLGADAGLLRSGANILGIASGDSFQSTTYTPGFAGWNISAAGNAEFANVRVRGAIQASVFEKSVVSAFAGSLIVAKSAGKISVAFVVDNTAVAFANTANLFITTGPDGGWAFATNDIIRIKAEYSGGVGDTWGTVTRTATLNEYTITINYGTINVTWPAGTAVVDYGVSGGGFFGVSADGTYGASAAWVLATHAGAPWTTFTPQVYAGTDGKLYAGAGKVTLDAKGASIAETASWVDANAYKIVDGAGATIAGFWGSAAGGGGFSSILLQAFPTAGNNSRMTLWCDAPTTYEARSQLYATSGGVGGTQAVAALYADSNAALPTWMDISCSLFVGTTSGGLHVGGTSDPGDNNLLVDGNVGIGTTSPTGKLSISDDSTNRQGWEFNGGATPGVLTYSRSAGAYLPMQLDASKFMFMTGNVGIGTTAPTALLDVNSDIIRLRTAKTPSHTGAGNVGDICWDSGYIYVCYEANHWLRTPWGAHW
jgi:hypothetical protein